VRVLLERSKNKPKVNHMQRPDHDTYYMNIAFAVRERADCTGQKVGAVIVYKNRIPLLDTTGLPQE
jgi:dCMP deaminase